MQNEFGSDMQVVLCEAQGATEDKMTTFALERGWLGNSVIWTTERVASTGMRGIPNYVLLDANGVIVMKGYSNSDHSKVVKKLEEMIKNAGKSPKGTPSAIAKINKLVQKGQFARAVLEANKAIERANGDDAAVVRALAEAAKENVFKSIQSQFSRITWLIEHGYALKAKDAAEALAKSTKGLVGAPEDWASQAEQQLDEFKQSKLRAEMSADKAISKVEASLYEDGPSKKLVKKFTKMREAYVGLYVLGRVEQLVSLASK